jgi:hypothetical protein
MAIIATKKMTKMYGMNSNAALIAIFESLTYFLLMLVSETLAPHENYGYMSQIFTMLAMLNR